MKGLNPMNTQLHAYLITYQNKSHYVLIKPVTKMVLAHSKKEAGDIFIKWLKGIDLYKDTIIVCVQVARKTKRNKPFITQDRYEEQNRKVNELYEMYIKKAGN